MRYEDLDPDELILRDYLALDRTVLANERTLLAYLRTAIALLAGGATLLKIFAPSWPIATAGGTLIATGVFVSIKGVRRYRVTAHRLRSILRAGAGRQA